MDIDSPPRNASASPARGASAEAIQHHYDRGNAFFRLWLDDSMTYSCALWDEHLDNDTLEAAQARKLDWHIEQAGARDAARVLDVGCGWGSTLFRLVRSHRVREAVGLTLSNAQGKWISDRAETGSRAIVESWADHVPEKPYDAIISIGAFEHFVQRGFSSEEKVAAYQRFFERMHGMLRVDCQLSLQTIAWSSVPANASRASIRHSVFIANRIFPESDLPHLHEIAKACQPYFEISLLRNDRTHYAKTCAAWLDRFRAKRAEAIAASDEKTVRDYDRYLDACVKQFDANVIELLRIAMRRVG